jgi:ABC-type sulfate transport system substrate-binding protein
LFAAAAAAAAAPIAAGTTDRDKSNRLLNVSYDPTGNCSSI